MLETADYRLFLREDVTTPFDSIKPLFPDGFPILAPFPSLSDDDGSVAYHLDPRRLTIAQMNALVRLLTSQGRGDEDEVREHLVVHGMGILDRWRFRIVNDNLFDDNEEARRFAGEFKALEKAPPIHLQLTPCEAFVLAAQLQLALRHPANQGASRQIVERFIRTVQGKICTPGGALRQVMERGWHREFDVKREVGGERSGSPESEG